MTRLGRPPRGAERSVVRATFAGFAWLINAALIGRVALTAPIYEDVTEASSIVFQHDNGATGLKEYQETMGSGVCIFDYDADGLLDVYLVNCIGGNRLYRNRGKLRFENVTESAGVGDGHFGMGAVSADYDNDGDQDLYVTNFGPNVLFENLGSGKFRDVSKRAGVDDSDWGCGAVFFDADLDGFLDLYVANYVRVARPDTMICLSKDKRRLICSPLDYPPAADVFYRNLGNGTFEDATEKFGFQGMPGRGLGVVTTDYDRDGRLDVYVANDLDPNFLFRNAGDGKFQEVGFHTGTSHSEDGLVQSGMGIAAGDYDNDGWIDLFVTNFVNQPNALYHNEGNGFFFDESASSLLGPPSVPWVGWGTDFIDFDLDGLKDLFVVNGHVEPDASWTAAGERYEQPSFLYRNMGGGKFADVTSSMAPAFLDPHVGRGAAVGDLDEDGDADLVIVNQNGRARLFENVQASSNHWIGFALRGTKCNRDAIGARVEVVSFGQHYACEVQSGGSFLSRHDARLLFGLGGSASVDSVIVHWPGGKKEVRRGFAVDRYHRLVEGAQ